MKGYLKYYEPFEENGYTSSGGWVVRTTKDWEINAQLFHLSNDSEEWIKETNPPKFMEIEFDVIAVCKYDEKTQKGYHEFVAKIRRTPETKTKIFLIDIDGTICEDIKNEDSHLYPTAKVIEGSLEQINKWYDEGNTIVFFTAREYKDKSTTLAWLWKHGFKFNDLITDKPRCSNPKDEYVYIDNRSVRGVTFKGNWSQLIEKKVTINIFEE